MTLAYSRPTLCRLKINSRKNEFEYKKVTLNVTLGILITMILCQVLEFFNITAASDINAFKMRLESGIFRDDGSTTPLVAFVERCINVLVMNVLPIVSIISITWILWTLISTILYLFRQPFFDEVYIAKKEYKRNKTSVSSMVLNRNFEGFKNNGALKTYGFFKCCLAPDCKSFAFYEASEGPMTVGDFLKQNAFKCMTMIAFCVMISDQTMLDLFYQGGNIGVYFFKKIAYDYDYTQIIDNFMTLGTDYDAPWDTSNNNYEGRNKTKVYDSVYKLLKSGCKTQSTRTTEFKSQMGRALVSKIDSMVDVPWDRKSFVASAELLPTASLPTNVPGESYYFNVEEFGFFPGVSENMTGYIHVRIVSVLDNQDGGVVKTTYPEAWTINGNSASIDMSKVVTSAKEVKVNQVNSYATVTFRVKGTDTFDIINKNGTTTSNGSTITIKWEAPDNSELVSISVGGIQISSDNKGVKRDYIMHYKANDPNNIK